METIDSTDGFDLKRIAQSLENLSAQYSMDQRSIFSLGDRFGTQLPYLDERRLKLFIVGGI
jgi:hypothetical protein